MTHEPLAHAQKRGQNFNHFLSLGVYKNLTELQLSKRLREFFPSLSIPDAYYIAKGFKQESSK